MNKCNRRVTQLLTECWGIVPLVIAPFTLPVCLWACPFLKTTSKMFASCYSNSAHWQSVWFVAFSSCLDLLWFWVSWTLNISVTISISWGTHVISSLGQQPVSSPHRCNTVARGVYRSFEFTLKRSSTGMRRGWGCLHMNFWTFKMCSRFMAKSLSAAWWTLATSAITTVSIRRCGSSSIAWAEQNRILSSTHYCLKFIHYVYIDFNTVLCCKDVIPHFLSVYNIYYMLQFIQMLTSIERKSEQIILQTMHNNTWQQYQRIMLKLQNWLGELVLFVVYLYSWFVLLLFSYVYSCVRCPPRITARVVIVTACHIRELFWQLMIAVSYDKDIVL